MSIFRDRVAIITGAGSGIGRALSEELARRGSQVVISDVNSERIGEVGKSIEGAGGKVTALTVDVSDYDSVKKMIDDTVAEHGRLDYIFNNAGIGVGGEARDVTIDDWRAVLNINLHGVVHGVAVAYPLMVKQGFGHIVNTASVEGLIPFPVTSSYVTSKYAVVGLSNSLRLEGADLGVKVSAVCPGYIQTRIFDDAKLVNISQEQMDGVFNERLGISSEECALVILKGVEKNKSIITVTAVAKILWWLGRISPELIMWMMRKMLSRARKQGLRIEE